MSEETKQLLDYLAFMDERGKAEQYLPKINRKLSLGLFAFVYEKARNLIDYQEEHLLLRRAITRILVRRNRLSKDNIELVGGLINELLMARYIKNDTIPVARIDTIKVILAKYFKLNDYLGNRKLATGESQLDFLLSLAGREIEEILFPSSDDALIGFAFRKVSPRIEWLDGESSVEEKDTRLLVALMRSIGKYEDRTVYYKLWKWYFPKWDQADESVIAETAKNYERADVNINRFLHEPIGEKLLRAVKKQIAPFEILSDLITRKYYEVAEMFSDPVKLTLSASDAASQRYQRARSALRRSAVNSFVYVFITKMVLAIAVEVPYEVLMGKVSYLPIGINLLFPPLLMLFLALSVETPTEKNTKTITQQIVSMVSGDNGLEKINFSFVDRKSRFGLYFFRIIYFSTFVLIFGSTVWLLRKLGFNIVSLGVFFFFVSTIAFFAYRIRSSFKELVVGEQNSNLISTIFDFLMLPFIKLGRTISNGLSNLNIFIFVFDIILEAPFKLILEVIEEWLAFLREKKEEALNVIK